MTPATWSSSEPHPDKSLENKGFQEIHQALARSFKVSVPSWWQVVLCFLLLSS